mmetsp:Transcript_104600/g.301088  ORF Transcript_104600/g.301088 Transcript_104600/m.301088 type:complete len:214 (-) Transcript_104600:682-1323(-)
MDECSLRVHQIKLVIDAGEDFGDGGAVADHAARAHDLGQIAARHNSRRLVVDAALESGGAPIDELDGPLRLNRCHSRVHVLRYNVAAVHHATRHVLAVARVALHEHGRWLEDAHRDLGHGKLLMVSLLGGNDGRIRRQHEMDARVRHQVRLELGDVHVERTVEAKGRRQRRDDLGQQPVQICVSWPFDVKVPPTNVVQRFVIIHDCDIGVLQQ